jgi:hypothetical protein
MRRTVLVGVAALVLASCSDSHTRTVVSDEPSTSLPSTSSVLTTSTTTPMAPHRDPKQRYRVSTTVLESRDHGPQLCLGGIATSYPPQCGGPDIAGWSWDGVPGKESANGTTWAAVTLIGTFDGKTFTLTAPPAPPTPARAQTYDFSPACTNPDGDPHADATTFTQPDDHDVGAVWVTAEQGIYNVVARPGAAGRVRQQIRQTFAGLLCIVERDQPSRASLLELQQRVHAEAEGSPLAGVFSSSLEERRGVVVVGCAIADDVSVAWAREHWGPSVVLEGSLQPVS